MGRYGYAILDTGPSDRDDRLRWEEDTPDWDCLNSSEPDRQINAKNKERNRKANKVSRKARRKTPR